MFEKNSLFSKNLENSFEKGRNKNSFPHLNSDRGRISDFSVLLDNSFYKYQSEKEDLIKNNFLSIRTTCVLKSLERAKLNISENFELTKTKDLLIQHIIQLRKKASLIIKSFLQKKFIEIKQKKNYLKNRILLNFKQNLVKIQSAFRGFLVRKSFERFYLADYVFLYNINKHSIVDSGKEVEENKVKLQMVAKKKQRNIQMAYSRYLKSFYVPIVSKGMLKKHYKVNFIINGKPIIDSRFQVGSDNKGNFYNIIKKANLCSMKRKHCKFVEKKQENFREEESFALKSRKHYNSYDSLSLSSKSNSVLSNDVGRLIQVNLSDMIDQVCQSELKSILRKKYRVHCLSEKQKNSHKVSFNDKIEYSY